MRKQRGRFNFSIKLGWGKIEPSLRFSGFTPLEVPAKAGVRPLTGWTLTELLIVIVIIGIMVAFAAPAFVVTKERALDREVKASLTLMRAAERIYKMEFGVYYPDAAITSDIGLINTFLKLSLPGSSSWVYSIDNTAPGSTGEKKVQAARSGKSSGRTWKLNSAGASEDPICTGTCPP